MHLDYDDMHSETDFRPEIQNVIYWQDKGVSANEQYEEPSKHIVSIGNHEKGMQNAYGQAGSGDPPPPYGQPDRKKIVFFTASQR